MISRRLEALFPENKEPIPSCAKRDLVSCSFTHISLKVLFKPQQVINCEPSTIKDPVEDIRVPVEEIK
jgi:hypothetical protein